MSHLLRASPLRPRLLEPNLKAPVWMFSSSNAGGGGSTKPILEQSKEDFDSVISTNVTGAFLTVQIFAKLVKKSNQKKIVLLSIVMGSISVDAYCHGIIRINHISQPFFNPTRRVLIPSRRHLSYTAKPHRVSHHCLRRSTRHRYSSTMGYFPYSLLFSANNR